MFPNKARKGLRRLLIGCAGFPVLSVGVAMLVLPGPAFLVIPLGLGILATEFQWAKRLRDKGFAWLRDRTHARGGYGKQRDGLKKERPGRRTAEASRDHKNDC